MAEKKKQHFVPKFYMSLFANSNKEFAVYNIEKRMCAYPVPYKNQCYKDYFYGKDGKEFNIAKAFLCYNLGAKQGEAEAFFHIALYYETGKSYERFYLEKDLDLALGFYEKAESLNVQGASERIKILQQSR